MNDKAVLLMLVSLLAVELRRAVLLRRQLARIDETRAIEARHNVRPLRVDPYRQSN